MSIVNVNKTLMELKDGTGYPVSPDLYTGTADKFIVFTYEDERGTLYGDDDEEYITAKINVAFYCPQNFNYMVDKAKIKRLLRSKGFIVESIESYLENGLIGTEYIRHTAFHCSITIKTEEN